MRSHEDRSIVQPASRCTLLAAALAVVMSGGSTRAENAGQSSAPSSPASDYFLRIDGIPGDSSDARHQGEIEVVSWSFGVELPDGGPSGSSGVRTGKPAIQAFQFTAWQGSASPMLFLACAQNRHIREATLTARKKGGAPSDYLVIKLSDVVVTSYRTGSADDATDAVSLEFATIEYEYRGQKADGTLGAPVKAGWDVRQNRPIP
jgi:type VI secretion system secreted protein Hcp